MQAHVQSQNCKLTLAFSRNAWSVMSLRNSLETVDDYLDEWDLNKGMWTDWTVLKSNWACFWFFYRDELLYSKISISQMWHKLFIPQEQTPPCRLLLTAITSLKMKILRAKYKECFYDDHNINEISLTSIEFLFKKMFQVFSSALSCSFRAHFNRF